MQRSNVVPADAHMSGAVILIARLAKNNEHKQKSYSSTTVNRSKSIFEKLRPVAVLK